MLKRNNKIIAIMMAFVFCLSFMAPAFIAPSVAEAAAFTATVSQSNNVTAEAGRNLGSFKVEVNVTDWSAPGVDYSQLLISYPTRMASAGAGVGIEANYTAAEAAAIASPLGDSGIRIVVSGELDNAFDKDDLVVAGAQDGAFIVTLRTPVAHQNKEKGWFYVHLAKMNAANYAGDVNVNLIPQSGAAFGKDAASVVVGKVNSTGSTMTTAKSVTKVPSGGALIDTITIFENMSKTIATGTLNLELVTKGYEWDTTWGGTPAVNASVGGLFSFADLDPLTAGYQNPDFGFTALSGDNKDTVSTSITRSANTSLAAGAIAIKNLGIRVDEKVAKVGQDIEVKVSGAGVTEQTVVVGQYVDFIANVLADTTTELTAGLESQKIGTFFVEEVAPGTLIKNRTILFELPAGVEWNTAALASANYEIANNSAMTFTNGSLLDARTLKFEVSTGSENSQNGAKVKFKSMKVDVSPSFAGDVVLTVKGKAGVEGTSKVSTVTPMIKMTATAPELNLGLKEQKVSDVEITETKADTIVSTHDGADRAMAFYLDEGFRFAKLPKVEVVEGDMVLEVNDVKIQAPSNSQNLLIVPIRAASYKTPAKIKISDIYVTADRNAPVGDVMIYAADTNTYSSSNASLTSKLDPVTGIITVNGALCNSFNNTHRTSFKYDTPASVAIAKNVTAPPVENSGTTGGGSGTFVIGSNIYTLNGITKIMDAAPYIKSSRTYVPYKYLAMALGVAESDIVWDGTAQTVTVTKGDKVVVATIGSTTLTVNGEATVMDVAPEISNSRTMLPARYLAEALGATVGWDAVSRTVVFQM